MGFYDKIAKDKGIFSVDTSLLQKKLQDKKKRGARDEYLKTKANPNNVDLSWYFRLIK